MAGVAGDRLACRAGVSEAIVQEPLPHPVPVKLHESEEGIFTQGFLRERDSAKTEQRKAGKARHANN